MNKKKLLITAAALLISSSAWAGALTVPNTFTAGAPAVAADVNANFTAAKTAVDDNNTRITALQAANQTAIATIVNVPANAGTALGNGTALMNAVAGITGASPTNQFTVKLATGTYDLGVQMLSLPNGVNIEGAGRGRSTITSSILAIDTLTGPYNATVSPLGSSTISKVSIIGAGTASAGLLSVPLAPLAGVVTVDQTELNGQFGLMTGGTAALKLNITHSDLIAAGAGRTMFNGNNAAEVNVSNSILDEPVAAYNLGAIPFKCYSVFKAATSTLMSTACL